MVDFSTLVVVICKIQYLLTPLIIKEGINKWMNECVIKQINDEWMSINDEWTNN